MCADLQVKGSHKNECACHVDFESVAFSLSLLHKYSFPICINWQKKMNNAGQILFTISYWSLCDVLAVDLLMTDAQ